MKVTRGHQTLPQPAQFEVKKITAAEVLSASQHTDIFLMILPRDVFTRKQL